LQVNNIMNTANDNHNSPEDILIVEDNQSDLELLSDILTDAGYLVRPANDVDLAMRSLQSKLPCLIIMDIKLPTVSGLEVCRRIKADPKTMHIPVVFISALTESSDIINAFQAGGADYISKPFKQAEVLVRIKSHLELHTLKQDLEERVQQRTYELEESNRNLNQEIITRSKAEEALKVSEGKYRMVADFNYDWETWEATDGKFIYVSPSCERVSGYKAQEFYDNQNFLYGIIFPEDQKVWDEHRKNVQIAPGFQEVQFRICAKDGSIRWIEHACRKVIDNGKFLGFRGSNRDITIRKQAEKALCRAKEDLNVRNEISNIFLTTPYDEMYGEVLQVVMKTLKSPYGTFAYIDENGDRVVPSMTRDIWDDCKMDNKSLFFPRKNWKDTLWANCILEKRTLTANGPFRIPKGHMAIKRAVATPIIHREEVIGNLMVGDKASDYDEKDIKNLETIASHTAPILYSRLQQVREEQKRKNAEKARSQLSTAIEQANEIIIITNPEGIIEYVNPAFEKTTGYSVKDSVGQKTSLLKSGKQDDLFYRKLWSTISRGDVWQGHFINKKKGGGHYDEEATITPVKNSAGDIINFVAIKRDVTNEIKMEEQLRQVQKMEAIGTLSGGIAHDFNNILGALIGYTELGLEDVADKPETYNSLQQVLVSAGRAKDLVNQILTFSRSANTEKKPIKAKLIVKEVCKFLRSSLPANVEIRQNLTAEKDIILADTTQFHQVLMNLCTNAGYAMKDDGGVLEVMLENIFLNEKDLSDKKLLETGPHLKLTVKDSGLGIRKEDLARIFDPYYTSKAKGEGTGLGLAVVHGIIKDHMGDIRVKSKLGSGSVFTVLIPLLNEAVTEEICPDTKSLPSGTETILFVDDEEILVNVAKMTLNRFGYKVVTAFNGEDALETFKLARDVYDLVITDRTMPGMSGYELTRELRKICPDISVIMCSGFEEKEDKINRAASNINGFISKPLDKKRLAFTVRRILDEKNA